MTFVVANGQVNIQMNYVFGPRIMLTGPVSKLVPGKYPLSAAAGGFVVSLDGATAPTYYAAGIGELTITVVSKRAIMGAISARFDNGTRTNEINGTFAAACTSDYINPVFATCVPGM